MTVRIENTNPTLAATMAAAMHSDDPEVQAAAWEQFHQATIARMEQDFEDFKQSNDTAILANRGYRQLTSEETKWYQRLGEVLKSAKPSQVFADILGEDIEGDIMPETIIEDVYRNLQDQHPLLQKVTFTYVKFATKWILNDHSKQKAVWGEITDEIAKEITSGFKVVNTNQAKLSAFAFIEKGMIDLGPVFLDAYIRAVLSESLYWGLEYGIVAGTGVDEPIGILRDIHDGVTVSTTDGYPKKTAKVVTEITPASYGALLAPLSKTESGASRTFSVVHLICNMTDYLTKIMPASTALTSDGKYVTGLFPFPTETIISNEMADGEAAIGILPEYTVFVGGEKNGVVEFSDEFKFLNDQRYFKVKQYANGRAVDDTSFLRLDISKLKPTYPTVNALNPEIAAQLSTIAENTAPTVPSV